MSLQSVPVRLAVLTLAILSAAALGGLWYSWQAAYNITLTINGHSQSVRLRAETVGEALSDAGIFIDSGDEIAPGYDTPLRDDMEIEIRKAVQVAVEVDGDVHRLYTHASDPLIILSEAGISLNEADVLWVDGLPAQEFDPDIRPPRVLRIVRALEVTIQEGGQMQTLRTTAATVGGALAEADVRLYEADTITPPLETPLTRPLTIVIERAKAVTILVDGQHIVTRAHGATVGDMLADVALSLNGSDYSIPDEAAPFDPGMTVRVIRVTETYETHEQPIPYERRYQLDPDLLLDTQQVIQPGENGIEEERFRIRLEDGREVSRLSLGKWERRAPRHEIVAYGSQVVVRPLNTPNGSLQYWRILSMQVSAYSPALSGISRDDPTYGLTALGTPITQGVVAADPDLIALGTEVYIEGYGRAVVSDSLEGEAGFQIRLGFADNALQPWDAEVDVFLLAPAPPEYPIILPEDDTP